MKLEASELAEHWAEDARWKGILRPYTAENVVRLSGTVHVEHSLARMGAEKLWKLLHTEECVTSLGAVTGNQAVQQVQAGLKSIYVSGWQVAADSNDAFETYPDQSLYPADSVPRLVRRINNAFMRADQIMHSKGKKDVDWFVPIMADAEAGFGGPLNAFELMKQMIEAGASAVHFEDQLASAKKCGHMGGKVLVPTQEFIQKLVAARLAADVCGVPTLVVARTDANAARLLTSDIDPRDQKFMTGERAPEGYHYIQGGLEAAIARGVAYAPYADIVWCETAEPNLAEAERFAKAIRKEFPGKLLAYNCSPSFNWKLKLDAATLKRFRSELAAMGYKYQFVTLAGFHSLNFSMFELSKDYQSRGMEAYAEFQAEELKEEERGYHATRHQEFVGTGYFDQVAQVISGGTATTLALTGSTEEAQFKKNGTPKGASKSKPGPSKRPSAKS